MAGVEWQTNGSQRNEIEQIMETAWNITDVALDAKEYILRPTNPWPAGGNTQVSGVFIYLVNVVSKMAIKQMGASSRQTSFNAVDYYGVILSWIVSKSKFRLHGNSFADIVLAKFHVACPPLFGIFGSENTAAGRQRLGWKDGMNNQTHYDNVNALAIGWGALTLRDYTRMAGESSAFPAWYYWQTIACIVNVPPKQLTTTHGILLKGLIDLYADKFIKFYGQAAIVALRQALIKLPGEAPESAAFSKVEVVRDNLKKKYGLNL
jgi:nucleoporin GLE1